MSEHNVKNRHDAEMLENRWREQLPRVPSAYKPRGRLTPRSILLTTAGALLAATKGAAGTFVAVAALSCAALALESLVTYTPSRWNIWRYGASPFPVWAAAMLLGFAALCASVAGPIAVVSWTLSSFNKRFDNRNIPLAVVGCVLAGTASFVLFFTSMGGLANRVPLMTKLRDLFVWEAPDGAGNPLPWAGGLFVSGFILWQVVSQLYRDKFCHRCLLYLPLSMRWDLSFSEMTSVVSQIKAKDVVAIADVLDAARSKSDTDGTAELWTCAGCGRQYLDVRATFLASWRGGTRLEQYRSSWLVGSLALSPEDALNTIHKR